MDNQINKILEELYLIDPDLKKEEALIKKILADMYAVRPDITAEPAFIASLRRTILERARELSSLQQPADHLSLLQMVHHRRFAFAGLAVLVVLFASSIFISQGFKKSFSPISNNVNSLSDNAFGPLAYQPLPGGRGGGGGGGGGGIMSAPQPFAAGDAGKEMMSPMIYPGPDYTQMKYVYEGGEFEVPSEGFVYKRKVNIASARSVVSALKDFPLSKLKNPAISDVTIFEDREFGYSISINMREGWISFFQNWEKWPTQDVGCANEECYRRDFISPSQFPADDQIVSISDSFLTEYGISKSGYGSGQVIKPWTFNPPVPMGAAESMPQLYSPDVNVIYPLLIDGKKVYDEWGNIVGINIYVNLKLNRVSSASNISINGYDQSKYTLVTDREKILEVASSGGATGDMVIMGWQGKTIDVKIGTPEVVYMQFYMYSSGKSELLYVPALRFPITNIPANASFYKENVIVPLAPDILSQILERKVPYPGGSGGGVVPMPVPVDDGGNSGSGAAPSGTVIEPVSPIKY